MLRAQCRRAFPLRSKAVCLERILAIKAKEVLTLNRDYFRLSRPYERRIYEIARKHCGRKKEFFMNLALLHKKMGSLSPMKKFRYLIKAIAESNHLPDYAVELNETDQVVFKNRQKWWKDHHDPQNRPILSTQAYERARPYVVNDDMYSVEQEWIQFWKDTGCPALKNVDAAFIGFCKARYIKEKTG